MTKCHLRVAIYVADLDVRGGTQKQVLKLAQYLIASGHAVTIFTPCYAPEKTYAEFSRLDVVSLRTKSNDHLWSAKLFGRLFDQLRLFLRSRSFDIVNPHDNRTKFFVILHAIFSKSKQIWQLNDLDPAFGITGKSKLNFIRRRISQPLNRYFAKIAAYAVDEITVNVTKNAQRVNKYLNKNATVVYCGVDFLQRRTAMPSTTEPIQIVSTGVVYRYRNYESLIAAGDVINKNGKGPVRLTIVGDTRYDQEYVDELKLLAKELAVETNFAGSVSQQELNKYYENAHVFAFINLDQSWGLAVFEAASMGLPVVLSSSVGAVELLERKPGIVVVNPVSAKEISDAVLTIVDSQDGYNTYCLQVAETVTEMSWDKMYSRNIESIFLNRYKGRAINKAFITGSKG